MLTEQQVLETLQELYGGAPPAFWFDSPTLDALATLRKNAAQWGELKALAKQQGVSPWDLEKAVDSATASVDGSHAHPVIVTMQDVEPTDVQWLWWPYLARGTLAMLDGDPGQGKSLLTLQLAAILSQGWAFPDQHGIVGKVGSLMGSSLFLAVEDSLAATIRPRLDRCGADLRKVHVLTGFVEQEGSEEEPQHFTLAHMPVLRAALEKTRPLFVVIDPIQAYIGAKVNMNHSNETRPLLHALAKEAERFGCVIVCVRHAAKMATGGKAMMRGLGGIDLAGAARTVLFVDQDPLESTMALMAQSKNNLGPNGMTQRFSRSDGRFQWAGVTRMDAETLGGGDRGPEPRIFMEVYAWLERYLTQHGSQSAQAMEDQMLEEGYKKDTIRRVKKSLGVISTKGAQGWIWHLPPLPSLSYSLSSSLDTTDSSFSTVTTATSITSYSSVDTTSYTHVDFSVSPENQGAVVLQDIDVSQDTEVNEVSTHAHARSNDHAINELSADEWETIE